MYRICPAVVDRIVRSQRRMRCWEVASGFVGQVQEYGISCSNGPDIDCLTMYLEFGTVAENHAAALVQAPRRPL